MARRWFGVLALLVAGCGNEVIDTEGVRLLLSYERAEVQRDLAFVLTVDEEGGAMATVNLGGTPAEQNLCKIDPGPRRTLELSAEELEAVRTLLADKLDAAAADAGDDSVDTCEDHTGLRIWVPGEQSASVWLPEVDPDRQQATVELLEGLNALLLRTWAEGTPFNESDETDRSWPDP